MKNYVICSSTKRNYDLVDTLNAMKIGKFYLISDPKDLTTQNLEYIKPSYVFFPHWSNIIGANIYDNFNCVIFHMTDLPFGRGGSPLQNLILRGFKDTKVSAIKCSNIIDGGDVYLKDDLSLEGSAEEILVRLRNKVEDMIVKIIIDNPSPEKQKGEITNFKRRKAENSVITDIFNLDKLYDFIRMLDADGYPMAHIYYENFKIGFSDAKIHKSKITANVTITQNE